MKTKAYANFNELVFEDRNKYYGAYALRKNYEDNLLIGLFFGMTFLGMVIAVPYVSSLFKDEQVDLGGVIIPNDPYVTIIDMTPKVEEPVKQEKSKPQESQPQESKKYTAFVASNDPDELTVIEDLDDVNPGKVNQDGKKDLYTIDEPETDGGGEVVEIKKGPYEYYALEVKPQYPGGDKAMYEFLGKNMKYPERAKEVNISGKVYISFVIDEFGSISQVSVLRGIGGGCDEEAARVIKKMPRWSPGKQGGHPVKVRYQIPIEFVLN
jgi:protein TonB